jgi:hypothetical protein
MTLQDHAASQANHDRFIQRVVASGEVWGLKSSDGWAICDSTQHVKDEEALDVMPFWSDHAYAKRAASGEWGEYVPTAIPLDLFIDRWLKGMHEDGTLVGTNWDAHNTGVEIDAVELAQALVEALEQAE